MFLLGGAGFATVRPSWLMRRLQPRSTRKLQAAGSPVRALVARVFANTELQVTTHRAGGMAGWNSFFARFTSQSEEDGTLGILSCAVLEEAQSGQFYGPGSGV